MSLVSLPRLHRSLGGQEPASATSSRTGSRAGNSTGASSRGPRGRCRRGRRAGLTVPCVGCSPTGEAGSWSLEPARRRDESRASSLTRQARRASRTAGRAPHTLRPTHRFAAYFQSGGRRLFHARGSSHSGVVFCVAAGGKLFAVTDARPVAIRSAPFFSTAFRPPRNGDQQRRGPRACRRLPRRAF